MPELSFFYKKKVYHHYHERLNGALPVNLIIECKVNDTLFHIKQNLNMQQFIHSSDGHAWAGNIVLLWLSFVVALSVG